MFKFINRLKFAKKLDGIGDPGIIVPYVNSLELEIAELKATKEELEAELNKMLSLLDNKNASIQHLEAVNRNLQ